jgi:lipoprotein-anchoring transpeptidase ErfK/SrfK
MKIKKLAIAGLLATSLFGITSQTSAASNDLIIINKKYNKLAFFDNGYLEMVEPVATGRTWNLTPVGKWKVVNKVANRPYYTKKIPGGDPRNPLGARWLGIKANGTRGNIYGIHGTNAPWSIGKYVSSGCVRMYNNDVIRLFNEVSVGTPVNITYSPKSFLELTKLYGYKFRGYNLK